MIFQATRGIGFFLFAPALQLCSAVVRRRGSGITAVVAGAGVTYANGANVLTSFLTNIWPGHPAMVVCGSLCKAIEKAQKDNREDKSARLVKYPANVVSGALMGKLAKRGIDWELPAEECWPISKLNCGQVIYGGGFLISERLAAERLAARECFTYELDNSEREIIASLGRATKK